MGIFEFGFDFQYLMKQRPDHGFVQAAVAVYVVKNNIYCLAQQPLGKSRQSRKCGQKNGKPPDGPKMESIPNYLH